MDDLDVILRTSQALENHYEGDEDWSMSPFRWLLSLPPGTKGKVGRILVEEWAKEAGLESYPVTEDNQHYLMINGFRVQVKTSRLWKTGIYKFQQIRDRDYDFCLFLGVSPHDLHMWLVPKDVIDVHVIGQLGQHTGADSSETFWVEARPAFVSPWLAPYGNSLEDARFVLSRWE